MSQDGYAFSTPDSTFIPPGFVIDPASGLYYLITPGHDENGQTGEWVTWYYPHDFKYEQSFTAYENTAPLGNNAGYQGTAQTTQAGGKGKKKVSPLLFIIPILILIGAGVAAVWYFEIDIRGYFSREENTVDVGDGSQSGDVTSAVTGGDSASDSGGGGGGNMAAGLMNTLLTGRISNSDSHTVAVKADGTLYAIGNDWYNRLEVDDWTNIIAVATGTHYTVGLRADGTVVSVGDNSYDVLETGEWRDIVAIAAGSFHTVGLRSDGTVVGVGDGYDGQLDVDDWRDIVAISCSGASTIGLKADGTVVGVGYNANGWANLESLTNIVAIASSSMHTVGIKADGTVVIVGYYDQVEQMDVSGWTNIVAVAAGSSFTLGVTADGRVLLEELPGYDYLGDVREWFDIIAVSASSNNVFGLRSDGTVVATGDNYYGQLDVSEWKLN
jgi:alpha-tubulin suppressor-like RCC1 family protein